MAKQIVTIFRAEGPPSRRMIRLCRTTRRAQLFALRDTWRRAVRSSACLSGFVEYLDGWSMGHDFERVLGRTAVCRQASEGELYFCVVTDRMRRALGRLRRQRQQFAEQKELLRIVTGLAQGLGACAPPVALAVFREIVGPPISDEVMKAGSDSDPRSVSR